MKKCIICKCKFHITVSVSGQCYKYPALKAPWNISNGRAWVPWAFPGLFGKQLSKPLLPLQGKDSFTVQTTIPDFSLFKIRFLCISFLESRKVCQDNPHSLYPLSTAPPEHGYCCHHHPRDSWLPLGPRLVLQLSTSPTATAIYGNGMVNCQQDGYELPHSLAPIISFHSLFLFDLMSAYWAWFLYSCS